MTTKLTTAHLTTKQLDAIDDFVAGCPDLKFVIKRRNNGTLELRVSLDYPTATPFSTGLIARMHVRDHKAFWMLVNQARDYLAARRAAEAARVAAEKAAAEARAKALDPDNIIKNDELARALAGKRGVHSEKSGPAFDKPLPWYKRPSEFPMGDTVAVARAYAGR